MSEPSPAQNSAPLSYATPGARPPRIGPGFVCMLTALGLIALGGCFLIGILVTNESQHTFGSATSGITVVTVSLTFGDILLELVLYLAAFGAFAGAIYLMTIGLKWLRKG